MDRRRRRPAGRLMLALVAAGVVSAAPALAASPASANPQRTYGGSVAALGIQVVADTIPPPIAIYDVPFGGYVAYGHGQMDNDGTAVATAASFTPGPALVGGVGLLCSQLPGLLPFPLPAGAGCPALPTYPLSSEASYPTHQDPPPATGWSGPVAGLPVGLTIGSAAAHAHATGTSTSVSTARAALLTGAPGTFSVGAAAAATTQTVSSGGVRITARADLSNIDIAGVVHIDALHTRTGLNLMGAGPAVGSSTVAVVGATAGGVAVAIDADGVHILGQGIGQGAIAAANAALAGQLAAHGVTVRLVGEDGQLSRGRTSGAGLLISFDTTIKGLPEPPQPPCDPLHVGFPCLAAPSPNREYIGTALLGATGAAVASAPGLQDVLTGLGGPPTPELPAPGAVGPPSVAVQAKALTLHAVTAPAPQLPDAGATARGFTVLGLSAAQLRVIYLTLIAGALVLFLSARIPHTSGWRRRAQRRGTAT